MSYWLNDPELFLYAKGTGSNDVQLWRCKKPVSSSSLVVPMKPDDFDFVSNVKDHMELIIDLFNWDETDYRRLVQYIFERHFLVNSQGFVIVKLYKVDKDKNKMTSTGANEEVPIYIRSLDVLPLKRYIPDFRERPIPLRTVRYLEDVDGKAAIMEKEKDDFNLAKRVADLELNNKTLEGKVTNFTADLATQTKRVADLELNNKTLDGKVTKLTADLATRTNELTTSQQKLIQVLKNAEKEVWMNDFTNSEWVGSEGVRKIPTIDRGLIFVEQQGTFTNDENDTNVRARYMYKVKQAPNGPDYKAVLLEDLVPNKEKARFSEHWYNRISADQKLYVIKIL